MTNNLNVLKKELKSFAKRVKDFKYTDSALIAFLLTGIIGTVSVSLNLYSAEDQIKKQAEAINSSMTHLKGDIKQARQNNKKTLRNENLELIQLMEQGDHVVKSPWSSWQYGINGFYNDWRGNYKGRGDKVEDVKYKRNKSMSVNKYETHPHTLYGSTTELGMKQEPNAMIPVSATLVPLTPTPKNADISMNVDISDLPSFNPRTVKAPKSPDVNTEVKVTAPTFSLIGESFVNGQDRSFDGIYHIEHTSNNAADDGGNGIIEGVSLLKGNFVNELYGLISESHLGYSGNEYRNKEKWKYVYTDYQAYNTSIRDSYSDNPVIGTSLSRFTPSPVMNRTTPGDANYGKTGFLKLASWDSYSIPNPASPGTKIKVANKTSTMINNANMISARTNISIGNFTDGYEGPVKEVVHLDIHGAQLISNEDINVTKVTDQSELAPEKDTIITAWSDFKKIATAKGIEKSQTFINSGTSVIEGEKVTYTNSYDHSDSAENHLTGGTNAKATATVINTGNLTVHPLYMQGKNFYPSAIGDAKYELNSDAAVFVVSPEMAKNLATNKLNGIPQILYNSGKINVYNKNSAVFFIK